MVAFWTHLNRLFIIFISCVVLSVKTCYDEFSDSKNIIDINKHCVDKNRSCITKCCYRHQIYFENITHFRCTDINTVKSLSNITIDYSKIDVYKSNIKEKKEKSKKNLKDHFVFVTNGKFLYEKNCSIGLDMFLESEPVHILEDGNLISEKPNHYTRFPQQWQMKDFCFEYLVKQTSEGIEGPSVVFKKYTIIYNENGDRNTNTIDMFKAIGMLISCFFLLVVLVVYCLLKELRNLAGQILMAYVGTLAVTFLFKAIELLGVPTDAITTDICKPMSIFLYYTFLSSFFWMNTMSFDIWWTFRGVLYSRPIYKVKFFWYGLYAWGVPLLPALAAGVIDYQNLTHIPQLIKPHFENCFFMTETAKELLLYLYIPLSILLATDWIFFLLTAYNIWLIKRNLAKFCTEDYRCINGQNRFSLYFKLSMVMGISWAFEVININMPACLVYIAIGYSSLIGLFIFLIFVFKRKILMMLCKRFCYNRYVKTMRRKSSTAGVNIQSRNSTRKSTNTTISLY